MGLEAIAVAALVLLAVAPSDQGCIHGHGDYGEWPHHHGHVHHDGHHQAGLPFLPYFFSHFGFWPLDEAARPTTDPTPVATGTGEKPGGGSEGPDEGAPFLEVDLDVREQSTERPEEEADNPGPEQETMGNEISPINEGDKGGVDEECFEDNAHEGSSENAVASKPMDQVLGHGSSGGAVETLDADIRFQESIGEPRKKGKLRSRGKRQTDEEENAVGGEAGSLKAGPPLGAVGGKKHPPAEGESETKGEKPLGVDLIKGSEGVELAQKQDRDAERAGVPKGQETRDAVALKHNAFQVLYPVGKPRETSVGDESTPGSGRGDDEGQRGGAVVVEQVGDLVGPALEVGQQGVQTDGKVLAGLSNPSAAQVGSLEVPAGTGGLQPDLPVDAEEDDSSSSEEEVEGQSQAASGGLDTLVGSALGAGVPRPGLPTNAGEDDSSSSSEEDSGEANPGVPVGSLLGVEGLQPGLPESPGGEDDSSSSSSEEDPPVGGVVGQGGGNAEPGPVEKPGCRSGAEGRPTIEAGREPGRQGERNEAEGSGVRGGEAQTAPGGRRPSQSGGHGHGEYHSWHHHHYGWSQGRGNSDRWRHGQRNSEGARTKQEENTRGDLEEPGRGRKPEEGYPEGPSARAEGESGKANARRDKRTVMIRPWRPLPVLIDRPAAYPPYHLYDHDLHYDHDYDYAPYYY